MSKGEIKNPFSGPSSDERLECLTSLDREIGEIKQFCSMVEKLKALQYLIVVVSTIDLAVWLTYMIPMATL